MDSRNICCKPSNPSWTIMRTINNRRGAVTVPLLITAALLLSLVCSAMIYINNTERMYYLERNRLQAEYNAVGGIWYGLLDWKQKNDLLPLNKSYTLPSGTAQVNIQSIDKTTIRITSYGIALSGKDGIEATYSLPNRRFLHWHKIVPY